MPRGLRTMRRGGKTFTYDVTPTDLGGRPINPPRIVGWHPGYSGE
jgi:hypothetical protein